MVQHSVPIGSLKELPDKPVNTEKVTHRFEAFLPEETEEGCVNPAPNKIIKDNQVRDESSSEIPVRLDDLALEQTGKEPIINRWNDERIDGSQKDL